MSTVIRPEVSEKNKYWIERHRYYELKHFCLQYPIWKKAIQALSTIPGRALDEFSVKSSDIPDPTERFVMDKLYCTEHLELIERTAKETHETLYPYILKAVTEGLAYETMTAKEPIPCSKDFWYTLYRRFFWLLDKARK